jgi:hypothetical protein
MYNFGANALNYAAEGMNDYYKQYAERRQKMLEEQYRQQQAKENAIRRYSQWTPKDLMDPKLAELRALIPEKTTGQQPTAAPKTQGVYGKGNINLNSRQKVLNPDGTFSTEESFSTNIDGEEVLLPTVIDGKHVSEQEAIDHYRQTGEYLGKFATPDEATEYAERLHKLQEKYYGGDQLVNNPLINNAREQLL